MTLEDFSSGFDTLLDSYGNAAMFGEGASKAQIVLDEYEKSLFLTNAQEQVILSMYTGRNISGKSFDETEELRRYLSNLIAEAELAPITNSSNTVIGLDSNSKFFTLPETLWFITYEAVKVSGIDCESSSTLEVKPARQDEYHRLRKNPFRGANDRRALRFDLAENVVEIVSKYPVTKYYVRYLKKLSPIILIDLPDGQKINGTDKASDCKVHESLHQRILETAVILAMRSRGYMNNNNENR